MSMIRLAAIKKSYESAAGEVTALKGVDLEIERGEIYGIIGLSGAGKSTLIRCINMLERPLSCVPYESFTTRPSSSSYRPTSPTSLR